MTLMRAATSSSSQTGPQAGVRVILYGRAAARSAAMASVGARVAATAGAARLGLPTASRRHARAGARIARRLDRLGGAYLKVGQVVSTRADLLSDAQRAPFAHLCDRATPVHPDVEPAAPGQGWPAGLVDIEEMPFATGSVTRVHLARRHDSGQAVVVKVLRSDAHARFSADLALIRGLTRIGAGFPLLASVPTIESVGMLSDAVAGHLDLGVEAGMHVRMAAAFERNRTVAVPRLHLDISTREALVMDYIAGARRIDDPSLDQRRRSSAALAAVRALYAMLFDHGVVHCDMHPGNLLVTSLGGLALIDFGYAATLDEEQQLAFADLFRAMAFRDPGRAADVIVRMASRLPDRLDRDRLVGDLDALLATVSGTTAAEFQVAGFVTRLFAIQRRHRIVASPGFTMGIVALVTLEGMLKQYTPTLDFQREAMPFVLRRLSAAQKQWPARTV
jgi:ubiquinone biosynthesis protein